ncbi:MAG: N-acetylmuramoyl-L-alanine amidase [Acidimicrobiia bacterium]|nr:N-acetylmuramoyl-L-alanine amidase [Acidimicrobiia bacterium]
MKKLSALVVMVLVITLLGPASGVGAAGSNAPIGSVDRVDVRNGAVVAHGWALDKDGSAPIMVHVYVDGVFAASALADTRRTDVGAVHGFGNYHGFIVRAGIGQGRHRVCVVAINDGPGSDPTLGCRTVRGQGTAAQVAPIGAVDRVDADGNQVTVSGWALDMDTRRPIGVHLFIDGVFVAGKKARGIRRDLMPLYKRGPWHGYGFDVTVADGRHDVCVVARDNARKKGRNTKLGCETISVGTGGGGGNGMGVVVSPSGVVLPVRAALADGSYRVMTPCTNEVVIADGRFVGGVDVVLDAGHGGSETGSVGSNGLVERDLNLVIAKKAKDILKARGYSVQLTRTTNIRLPLVTRGEIANSLDPLLFVSVHHNGGAVLTRSTPGTETYYQHDSDDSKRLSGILYEELKAAMGRFATSFAYTVRAGVNTRVTSSGDDYYGIHRYTPGVPSTITEPGYLSNPSEAALFARADVQDAEAVAIADGIQRYLNTNDSGSGYNGPFTDSSSGGTGGTGGCVDPPLR